MKTAVEPLEGNKVRVSVEVGETEFQEAIDSAYRRIAQEVRIPGFRPGKAPRRILEAHLGGDVARGEALREALPEYYARAVNENDVDVIAPPEIDITDGEEAGPVSFDAVVEVRPRVTIQGYADLEVTIPRPASTDEVVDAQIERLRDQSGELAVVDRAARDGDHVTIDIAGSHEGEPIDGLVADDYLYEIGSEAVVPEIDANLRRAKVGDILEFDAKHPEDDQDPLSFRILVKEIKEKVLPEVDDEWVNEASEFDTVEELRADLARRVMAAGAIQAQLALRERAAEALGDLVIDDPPEPLVDSEVQHRLRGLLLRLEGQGIELDEYLATAGQDQEAMVAEMRDASQAAVRVDLALRAVVDAETIEVSDDEVEVEVASIAERVGEEAAKVRADLERAEQVPAVRSDIKKQKALEWLVEHVSIVDDDGDPIDRADLEIPADDADDADDSSAGVTGAAEPDPERDPEPDPTEDSE